MKITRRTHGRKTLLLWRKHEVTQGSSGRNLPAESATGESGARCAIELKSTLLAVVLAIALLPFCAEATELQWTRSFDNWYLLSYETDTTTGGKGAEGRFLLKVQTEEVTEEGHSVVLRLVNLPIRNEQEHDPSWERTSLRILLDFRGNVVEMEEVGTKSDELLFCVALGVQECFLGLPGYEIAEKELWHIPRQGYTGKIGETDLAKNRIFYWRDTRSDGDESVAVFESWAQEYVKGAAGLDGDRPLSAYRCVRTVEFLLGRGLIDSSTRQTRSQYRISPQRILNVTGTTKCHLLSEVEIDRWRSLGYIIPMQGPSPGDSAKAQQSAERASRKPAEASGVPERLSRQHQELLQKYSDDHPLVLQKQREMESAREGSDAGAQGDK